MNECFQILGTVPTRFMAQITLLNISLMQTFLQFHHNQDITWDEYCRLCDSAWAHAFASLLDRAMFEPCPVSESTVIRSLAKLCSCSIILFTVLDINYSKEERIKLYERYSEHRTLYINSFNNDIISMNDVDESRQRIQKQKQHQLTRDLTIVQRLLFT
ncbi:hypothetical protein BDC45DRAFT_215484 [Circinella umbellata]|nr:hypothetical protein BDC45DRAFT_215484 [Circinella umbellata]